MRLLKKSICAALVGLCAVTAQNASAGATGVLDLNNPCTASNWQITGAIPSSLYPGIPVQPVVPISATSCAGIYTGNDGPALNPDPNLGYLNDGLLNGQFGLLSPTQFLSSPSLSQLQALKDPNKPPEDPGWIMLGQMNQNAGELSYSNVTPAGGTTFNLSDVVKYTQTKTTVDGVGVGGSWLLEINKDIVNILQSKGFGSRSVFDHLAFEVKSSTSWAVYDFDFTRISGFDLSVPYTIAGTWMMNGDFEQCKTDKKGVVTCNAQDISHMSVWARDPVTGGTVPEPGSLALIGLALAGLAVARRRKQAK